ncbi:MAG: hypothetical protein GY763_10330 [Gammaproteobacteria bacterium]|nr:hypothetical protein [Gammaproteobacteria bacterium]
MNRRKFIKGLGITSVLVAGGGVWRAHNQGVFATGEGAAYQEWHNWKSQNKSGLPGLVQSAILAASPHNTQPWLFQLSESSIDIFADSSRNIGAIDPLLREMHIGLGCALENLLLAAKASGYSYKLDYFPDESKPEHAIHIDFSEGDALSSSLFHAIPHRHTNRGPHDLTTPVSTNQLQTLSMLGEQFSKAKLIWLNKGKPTFDFLNLNAQATDELIHDEEQSMSSFRWFRGGWDELQEKKDGVSIDTTGIPMAMRVAGKMMPVLSRQSGDQYFLDAMKNLTNVTDRVGIITVEDVADKTQRLQAGRYWQRMHLWGTTQQLAMQPVNQVSERIDRAFSQGQQSDFSREIQNLISHDEWQALMPFRIGTPLREALPSPRRLVREVIV